MYQGRGGQWLQTTAEKKRILLNNIYGVDIDSQAVEVTKLSLLLKVLENENQDTLARQLKLWRERALPDLGSNIKCGNSLIGSDFYRQLQLNLFNEDEQRRINAFDWETEFAHIFPPLKAGRRDVGFDAVIGNPPYVRQEMLGKLKEYFEKHYEVYHGVADLYAYFIERGVKLLKPSGQFGYIVANKWLRANYGEPLRRWLKQQRIEEIVDFGDLPVFQKATTYACILRISRDGTRPEFPVVQVKTLDFSDLSEYVAQHRYPVKQAQLEDGGWALVGENIKRLLEKIKSKGVPLGKYVDGKIYRGILTGLNKAFVIDEATRQELIEADPSSAEIIKPFLAGRDVKRYQLPVATKYLLFIPKGWTNEKSNFSGQPWKWLKENYPAIATHLVPFEQEAKKRYDQGDYWWELRACEYYGEFEKTKIIYPNICQKPEFTFDANRNFTNQKCFIMPIHDKYFLGILNSALMFFIFQNLLPKLRGGFYEPSYVYFKDFPIRPIDFSDPADKSRYDHMVQLVETMLDLHRRLQNSRLPQEQTQLQRRIATTDREIDQLVYDLYRLTEEEIGIVEGDMG